jgi:hypothetical protein
MVDPRARTRANTLGSLALYDEPQKKLSFFHRVPMALYGVDLALYGAWHPMASNGHRRPLAPYVKHHVFRAFHHRRPTCPRIRACARAWERGGWG